MNKNQINQSKMFENDAKLKQRWYKTMSKIELDWCAREQVEEERPHERNGMKQPYNERLIQGSPRHRRRTSFVGRFSLDALLFCGGRTACSKAKEAMD